MVKANLLQQEPPIEAEWSIQQLGENLRTARIRRDLTLEEVAAKIGTGRRAVMDAERGKGSTSIGTYFALLWLYGLLSQLDEIADPASDDEGIVLASKRERKRVRKAKGK